MADWKVSGVVQDSEDEDDAFDSQELDLRGGSPSETKTKLPSKVADANASSIWDIPSSPPDINFTKTTLPRHRTPLKCTTTFNLPDSSPLSPAPDDDDELFDSQYDVQRKSTAPAITKLSSIAERDGSPDPLGFREDHTSTSRARPSLPRPELLLENEANRTAPLEPPASNRTRARSPTPSLQATIDDAEQEGSLAAAQAAAWRYERSLRPRKPIQEHPYLLESAQYSSVLRSHGVRPIRLHQQDRQRRSAPEEDSQEQEFQEDSQNTVSDGAGNSWEETQVTEGGKLDAPPLEPRFPPSSSDVRTASPRNTSTPETRGTNPTSPIDSSDEELPTVEDIFRRAGHGRHRRKRHVSPGHLSAHKRRRREVAEGSAKRPQLVIPPPLLDPIPIDVSDESQSVDSPLDHSTFAVEIPRRPVTPETTFTELEADEDLPEDPSDVESNTNVTLYRRQARGVLPASHFRLDQATAQTRERQSQAQAARKAEAQFDQRRGVAVRTISSRFHGSSALPPSVFDDSDSDRDSQSAGRPEPIPSLQTLIDVEDGVYADGSLSAMEDNAIDHMIPAQSKTPGSPAAPRSLTSRQKTKQSRITSHITRGGNPAPASKGRHPAPTRSDKSKPAQQRKRGEPGQSKLPKAIARPPNLGILDVIELQAPQFLKVAARTARGRKERGRSSPGRKTIHFATREDQLDAGGVLLDWKRGKIRQRSITRDSASTSRPPLARVSLNAQRISSTTGLGLHTKASSFALPASGHGKQTLSNATDERDQTLPRVPQLVVTRRRQRKDDARPAQFEEDLAFQPGRLAFHKQKRLLDTLYRRTGKPSTSLSAVSVRTNPIEPDVLPPPRSPEHVVLLQPPSPAKPPRRRLKKTSQPCRVDTASARYVHAHDPLPTNTPPSPLPTTEPGPDAPNDVLCGLGPFGTHYSQHFEFFPLPAGVFFHGDTLPGNGCLDACMDPSQANSVWLSRPRVFMNLNGQSLRWGTWNDEVSSELGILMDAVGDQLTTKLPLGGATLDTKAAVQFVRQYVQDAISTPQEAQLRGFVLRLRDVVGGLLARLGLRVGTPDVDLLRRTVEVLMQLLVTVVHTTTLCQQHDFLLPQRTDNELLLQKMSKACISCLLQLGTKAVDDVHRNAQHLSFRERGIRTEHIEVQAWVLLMRTLGRLRIPRMGFWDVLYSVLIQPGDQTSTDVWRFEELWQTLFALLPLCEFDESGVVQPGSRQRLASDGWALPQLVLRRVFEVYKSNNRQPPSFNNYCRALISRCHYLVDQWGWLKCRGLIGSIFDFFASMNLSHLRNEEVGQSPAFLEELHLNPSLQVLPQDRCFHIFLKLVAITIKRLSNLGSTNDIHNLVFRILPNHNRQHLKEQDVYEHDLAALRNHHDLLCTLFWAAPPDLRPQLSQLEKLVNAVTSHKEACMINLRAWSQIARLVANKETAESFSPLFKWQAQTFQQLLDQYNSIATDIQQQFQDMSRRSDPDISQDIKNSIIVSNKAATMDVLSFSVTLSQDVARHAHTVELAILAGNYFQIQQVFQHFSTPTPEYPWAILQRSVSIMGSLLDRIELETSQRTQTGPSKLDESIMLLDHNLTASFFCMARRMTRTETSVKTPLGLATVMAESVRQVIVVAGKMAALLVLSGTMRLSQCFRPGRQCLFEDVPTSLTLHQRRYLPLFLGEVQRRVPVDLTDMGSSPLHLWLQSLVKPQRFLGFEREWAVALLQTPASFLPPSAAVSAAPVNYEVNRSLFEYALSWMRQSLQAVGVSERKGLVAGFSDALRETMKQIELDLLANVADETEHPAYVSFVRCIISLIKSHGAGICTITPYFYRVSREYSPPQQDPHLQVAQIQSYGIRLAEGDPRIAPQLFSFLHHNFKQALLHGKLRREVSMLQKGLKSSAAMTYTLSKMLPAIIQASLSKPETFVMFDVFCEALCLRLNKPSAPCQLGRHGPDAIASLIQSILDWVAATWSKSESHLRQDQIHMLRKMVFLLNQLQPNLESHSLSLEAEESWDNLEAALGSFNKISRTAEHYFRIDYTPGSGAVEPWDVFAGCGAPVETCRDAQVASLADELVTDVSKTWVVSAGCLSVQAPARGASQRPTQSGRGLKMPVWDIDELVASLHEQLCVWNAWWDRCRGRERTSFGAVPSV